LNSKEVLLIIGVNSRPIAASAKRLGYNVNVVDYWGDKDLKNIADDILVIKDYEKELKKSKDYEIEFTDMLFQLTEKMINRHPEISSALIGSGLDDRYDLWDKISKLVNIIGNKPQSVKNARERYKVMDIARKSGLHVPKTENIDKISNIYEFCSKYGFPIVFRPIWASGGGRDIIKIGSEKDIENVWNYYMNKKNNQQAIIQEFIPGIDASITSNSCGQIVNIISINEQLIGLEQCYTPTPFMYCGNIIPLNLKKQIEKKIINSSLRLLSKLKLHGINGVDLKIYGNKIYFMEINPRFPGTIELIELLTEYNMVKLHIDACDGIVKKISIPYNKYGIKIIPYAKSDFIFKGINENYVYFDIPQINTVIKKGEPILTIQIIGKSRNKILKASFKYVENLYL